MAVNLLVAPAAHGKTAHALARLREVRQAVGASGRPGEAALAPIAVVLPNQTQLLAFRARLASQGGALGVSLYTFYGLYAELLARAGRPLPVLNGPAQIRLLRVLIGGLAERGELRYFASIGDKPGFAVTAREAIDELKRARVFTEQFTEAARGLSPGLEELAALYATYQRWLLDHEWADPEGLGWLAAIALETDPALGRELRLLVVDGFDEFNPTQMAVLTHLAVRAKETLITLTGDPRRQRLAHRRFQRAEQQLRPLAGQHAAWDSASDAAQRAPDLAADLRTLEAKLFEPPAVSDGLPSRGAVEFLEAQTRAAEARAALRWIKQRLVTDGMALTEVAVLARSLDPYRPFLDETAREFGLPLHILGGGALADNPLVSALLDLLGLSTERESWRPRTLLAAWHSPYFDWSALGLDASHAATLEAVARLGRVVQGSDQWREALHQLAGQPEPGPDDEPESDLGRPTPEAIAQARAAFESFITRLRPPPRAPLPEYVAFVEDLIGDDPAEPTRTGPVQPHQVAAPSLNVGARALAEPQTAARDLAALRVFKDILRGLVLTEQIIGAQSRDWEFASFVHALREAVAPAAYEPGLSHFTEPDQPAVSVASVLDARGLSFRAVAILGLAEGEFPLAEHELPLLREIDRAALEPRGVRLESRLHGDEATIFYEAVTRARERLLLCRPYLADDGQQWEPSAYWREAHRLLGEPQPLVARPEDRLRPQQVASRAEWVEQGYDLPAIAAGVAVLQARQAAEAAGLHEGQLPELSPLLLAQFPETRSWSASRLEAYGTCRYFFYAAHVLKLEPRPEAEAGYDVRALGGMYHTILERLYCDAPDPANLAELLARLPEVAHTVFAAAPATYGFRPTALWEQQQAELIRILRDTVSALADKAAGWTPRYFEQRFGFGEQALVVHTPTGEVRLHGYIDRIDVEADGRLRIVDYKASGAPITADDLKEGHRLQLSLYALAARDALGLGEVAEGFYWHISKAAPSSLKLEKLEGGVQSAFNTALQHVAAHVAGIRGGQFQPAPPADGCPQYCPAVNFCWRYQPRSF